MNKLMRLQVLGSAALLLSGCVASDGLPPVAGDPAADESQNEPAPSVSVAPPAPVVPSSDSSLSPNSQSSIASDPLSQVEVAPQELGDDATLDRLWLACARGDLAECDELLLLSPDGSAYEDHGYTCGGRSTSDDWCVDQTELVAGNPGFPAPEPSNQSSRIARHESEAWATDLDSESAYAPNFGDDPGWQQEESSESAPGYVIPLAPGGSSSTTCRDGLIGVTCNTYGGGGSSSTTCRDGLIGVTCNTYGN